MFFTQRCMEKKTIYLFPYEQGKNLHRYPFTCRSYVNVEKPDYERYPGLKEVKGYKITLKAGETLFIPAGYWHHIVYDEAGYAVQDALKLKSIIEEQLPYDCASFFPWHNVSPFIRK